MENNFFKEIRQAIRLNIYIYFKQYVQNIHKDTLISGRILMIIIYL